jgi:hypothetical protein
MLVERVQSRPPSALLGEVPEGRRGLQLNFPSPTQLEKVDCATAQDG